MKTMLGKDTIYRARRDLREVTDLCRRDWFVLASSHTVPGYEPARVDWYATARTPTSGGPSYPYATARAAHDWLTGIGYVPVALDAENAAGIAHDLGISTADVEIDAVLACDRAIAPYQS